MLLEELILEDYGNIPQKVGSFLLKNNSSTLQQIINGTGFTDIEVVDGLSILIQKRFVKYFIYEKIFKYHIDRKMIKRRIYFPIYTNFITSNYSTKHSKLFSKVLIRGTFKEAELNPISEDLILANILKIEPLSIKRKETENIDKHFKPSERFIIVNFDFLDQKIFEEETIKLISKRYNDAAASVLKSVLKCEIVDKNSIIKNLESTKILISDSGTVVNEKDNINEYLRYLCASKVLNYGFDEKRAYFFNSNRGILKTHRIILLLKDPSMRRIFRMILEKEIEDKEVTIHSLLSVNKIKLSLLALQRLGLISQKCMSDYSTGSRIDHSWFVNLNLASLSMIKKIETQIAVKLKNINTCWDGNYFMDSSLGNSNVWTSDMISLATDHLILGIDLL